jgi:alpha-D-xyloside xylohydrolase
MGLILGLSVLFPFALTSAAHGQEASQVQLSRSQDGVSLVIGNTRTGIEIWQDGIVHVTHRPNNVSPAFASLSVVTQPEHVDWQFQRDANSATLTTSRLVVRLNIDTGAVSFSDRDQTVLLAEKLQGTWLSASVAGNSAWVATTGAGSKSTTEVSGQQFELASDESIYGLGQHPGSTSMDYTGSSVQLLQENTRVAIPVLLSSKGYALFWDNPAITNVDVGKSDPRIVQWLSEAGSGVDYYFLAGPEPDHAIAEYRWLTGNAPLFPLWAWGFWQSRERYKTQQEILDVAGEYRSRDIPFDGIIQDWQYWAPLNQDTATAGWGSHEFDPSRYPDPAAMIRTLHDEHVHLMAVSWAKFDVTRSGVSIPNLRELEAVKGAFDPAIPYVFPPGQGKWYDPFNDRARQVYSGQMMKKLFSLGVDAWWLDSPEPELSGNWGEFRNFKTALGPGALVYNAYPLEHTRAVYEGQRDVSSEKRVFLLTRSAYAGQQRYAAVTWSGDIRGTWEVFERQVPAGLNFAASGVPYWNTDIGGFFGSNPDDPKYVELFTRWFQWGAFTPMFRVHGTDKPKEVWRFDPDTQKILIDAINLRYHLLPYIYSVSWMVSNSGYTMMRPLVMDFRDDAAARKIGDQFMFGPAILVNPVTHPGVEERAVYLPKGTRWIDFWTGASLEGGETIQAPAPIKTMPLYIRAGSIVPYGPSVRWATEKVDAPIEIRIYPGANGEFTLYDDEGDNYNYEKGAYATIPIQWNDRTKMLTIGSRKGSYPGMPGERVFEIVYVSQNHGAGIATTGKVDRTVTYRGSTIEVHLN